MPDIFDEVEGDLRRERLTKAWTRYAPLFIGLLLVIVFGVGGWRLYQHFQTQRQAADGDRYYGAMKLSSGGQHEDAAAAFVTLSQDGTAGYRTLARLRAAAETALRDPGAAVAAYDAFAADTSQPSALRDVARLRAGYLLVDAGTVADAQGRVGALAEAGNPLRHSAREILGLAAWRAGDIATARKWLEALVADGEAAQGFRQRGEVVLDLIAAGEAPPAPPVLPPGSPEAPLPEPALDSAKSPGATPPDAGLPMPAVPGADPVADPAASVPSLALPPGDGPSIMSAPPFPSPEAPPLAPPETGPDAAVPPAPAPALPPALGQ